MWVGEFRALWLRGVTSYEKASHPCPGILVTTDYILGRSERILVDVSELTDEQISHISLIVSDMSKLNRNSN